MWLIKCKHFPTAHISGSDRACITLFQLSSQDYIKLYGWMPHKHERVSCYDDHISLILKSKWTTVLSITGFLFKGYCPIQVILVIKFFYTVENAKEMIRFFEKERGKITNLGSIWPPRLIAKRMSFTNVCYPRVTDMQSCSFFFPPHQITPLPYPIPTSFSQGVFLPLPTLQFGTAIDTINVITGCFLKKEFFLRKVLIWNSWNHSSFLKLNLYSMIKFL